MYSTASIVDDRVDGLHVVTGKDAVPESRIWASRWYRITPRSFVHEELFFDPEEVVRVAAGESYKSLLLRRDGRAEHAHRLGQEYRDLPADRILTDDANESILASDLETIRVSTGTLFRKPKLRLIVRERNRDYYHHSRRYDPSALAEELADQYPSTTVTLDGEDIG